jgi:hypothetical protein
MKARWSERSRLMASMVYDAREHSGSTLRENQVKRPASYKKLYIYNTKSRPFNVASAWLMKGSPPHATPAAQKKDGRFIQSRNPVKM